MRQSVHEKSSTEKRLKVLLLDNDDFSDYTSYFARGLAKYADVTLYLFSKVSPNVTGAVKQKGIRFNYINKWLPKGRSSFGGILRALIMYFVLINILLRTKYEIVHIQDYLPAFFLFVPILKLKRKKICWTLHDLDIFLLWQRLFATGVDGRLQVLFRKIVTQPSFLAKCADAIFVHALSHKELLVSANVCVDKIHVLRQLDYKYLLDLEDANSSSQSHKCESDLRNNILFFGNIAPWKGIGTLIEAMNIVRNKTVESFSLVIAGKPYPGFKDINFFESIKNEQGKFICIIDKYFTSSEIPELIRKSSFLVLPYDSLFQYSSSGVIPLSYTFGKPVIVSSVPSLAEYVENGKTGLVFEINNTEQLANCIIELLGNNSKCQEMGRNAYEKMLHEMSLEKTCKGVTEVYKVLE